MRWPGSIALTLMLATGLAQAGAAQAQSGPAISLTRMAASLKQGQVWGKVSYGAFCVLSDPMIWDAANNKISKDEAFVSIFRDELSAGGVQVADNPSDLFQSKATHADLQVGALIADVYLGICLWEQGVAGKGTARMDVEWQVFSTLQDRVVGRVKTHGEVALTRYQAKPDLKLLTTAFAANAKALAASPEFRALLTATPTPSAPPPRQALPDLRIDLPAAARPMTLGLASKAVVSIFVDDSLGSGLLVTADGYILTNQHVAGSSGKVRVRWPDGSNTVGEVVRADRRRDVALVKTTPPAGVVPLAVRHKPVELGETVYAIGTPREKEFAGTLTRGAISTIDREIEGQAFIQSDVAMTHGNSGGPLLDEKGWVVGIAHSVYEPNGVGQNINFFIPIDEALKALALKPVG